MINNHATPDDMIELGHAIHDAVTEKMNGKLGSTKAEIIAVVVQAAERLVADRLDAFRNEIKAEMQSLRRLIQTQSAALDGRAKAIEDANVGRLSEFVAAIKAWQPVFRMPEQATPNVQLTLPERFVDSINANVIISDRAFELKWDQPAANITLPPMQVAVNVPEQPAANITLPPMQVAVNVPEQPAPMLTMPEQWIKLSLDQPAANVTVNVPQQEAPDVVVNVAAQEPAKIDFRPEIKVEPRLVVPPRTTKTTKSILYGPSGRPETIEESVKEE